MRVLGLAVIALPIAAVWVIRRVAKDDWHSFWRGLRDGGHGHGAA